MSRFAKMKLHVAMKVLQTGCLSSCKLLRSRSISYIRNPPSQCFCVHSHILNSKTLRHRSTKTSLQSQVDLLAVNMSGNTTEELLTVPRGAQGPVNVGEADGWLSIGPYNIFAWSVSGIESCVVVKSEDVQVVFDMGVAVPQSVRAMNVFITHGHIDHIGGVSNHVAKRNLNGMKPARYFVPPHLVENLKKVTHAHYEMAQNVDALENVKVLPFSSEDIVRLNSRFFVKTFPTIHRVPSQGFILYKEEKKLKEMYKGKQGFEVAALHRAGTEIHDTVITPEVAYTGDTTFDVFLAPPTPDLLKVKLLITEATFLDDDLGKDMVQKARDRGHTHLVEFAQNSHLFKDVSHILLVHFSNKYPPKYICDCLRDKLPADLRFKVTPGTVAKATIPTSYL